MWTISLARKVIQVKQHTVMEVFIALKGDLTSTLSETLGDKDQFNTKLVDDFINGTEGGSHRIEGGPDIDNTTGEESDTDDDVVVTSEGGNQSTDGKSDTDDEVEGDK